MIILIFTLFPSEKIKQRTGGTDRTQDNEFEEELERFKS